MIKTLIVLLGFTIKAGVEVTPATLVIAKDIRLHTSKQFTITSAYRSPEKQVKIMIDSYHKGKDVHNIYGKKIIPLIPYLQTKDYKGLLEIIIRKGNFSKHLCGKALDLRIHNLTPEDINDIKGLEKKGKYKVIIEHIPPHVHIESLGNC